MSTITIPQSIFIEGQWFDAHWLAEVVDDATGELVITATTTTQARIIALRMTTDLVRQLRVMAGFDTLPYRLDLVEKRIAGNEEETADTYDALIAHHDRLSKQVADLEQLVRTEAALSHDLDERLCSLEAWRFRVELEKLPGAPSYDEFMVELAQGMLVPEVAEAMLNPEDETKRQRGLLYLRQRGLLYLRQELQRRGDL